jgi:hypothetical protein
MKMNTLLYISLFLFSFVNGVFSASCCSWHGTAPSCGWYCNVQDNINKGWVPAGSSIFYIFKNGESCVANLGNYNIACPEFGEGCTNGGCKVWMCYDECP